MHAMSWGVCWKSHLRLKSEIEQKTSPVFPVPLRSRRSKKTGGADHVLIYRHLPLRSRYCQVRLRTYGKRCGVQVTPHQLRHSCATLLLNAGAPILTVQTILGHQHIDTTLGYARLYDGTVAADYYRAMARVEQQMSFNDNVKIEPPNSGQLLALVDALHGGTLNESQQETVRALRAGIMAERDSAPLDTDRQLG